MSVIFQVNDRDAYAYGGGKAFDSALPTVVFIHGAQNDHSVWGLQSRWFAHHGYGVLALDLPSDSVDLTFCAGVIHHTPDPAKALGELSRITKPGGHIYLAVYNKWHPYFWLVHKATSPLRNLHWRGWQRLSRFSYRLWKLAVQPISYVAFGRALDEPTCRALYMDQVLTPFAHLFSVKDVAREARAAGLEVVATKYALRALMVVAILRVRDR